MFPLASPQLRRVVLAVVLAIGLLTLAFVAMHHGASSRNAGRRDVDESDSPGLTFAPGQRW